MFVLTTQSQVLNTLSALGGADVLSDPHLLVESLKFGYSNRQAMGDPQYVGNMQSRVLPTMTSTAHAAVLASRISRTHTCSDVSHYSDLVNVSSAIGQQGTTHVCVCDKDGNVVSLTTTVNLFFGSGMLVICCVRYGMLIVCVCVCVCVCVIGVQSESTGLLWNDEMDDFSQPTRSNAFGYVCVVIVLFIVLLTHKSFKISASCCQFHTRRKEAIIINDCM
jgi:gamma-glutamyltranspeptidase